jgi:hypothetical protein
MDPYFGAERSCYKSYALGYNENYSINIIKMSENIQGICI